MAFNVINQSLRRLPTQGYARIFNNTVRHFSVTSACKDAAYDADGKTVVNILNNEEDAPLMINGYSPYGFRLNNGMFAIGPVAVFPRSILSWNVEGDHEINAKSLSLFLHMSPRLDILIIGMSDPRQEKLIQKTREYVHKLIHASKIGKMNVEVLPTEKAVTVFNFLNSEYRFVGGAFIPPVYYSPTAEDEYKMNYLNKKKEKGDFFIEEH